MHTPVSPVWKTDPHWIGESVQFPGHANPWRRWLLLFLGGGLWNLGGFEIHAPRFQPYWINFVLFSWCFLFFSGKFSPTVFWSVASSNTSPTSKYPGINVHSIIYYLASWHDLSIQPPPPPSQGWFTKRELLWKHDFWGGQGDMFGRVKGSRAEIDGWNWFVA